jgi:drug/metabolite transporter (DMT)-like permease
MLRFSGTASAALAPSLVGLSVAASSVLTAYPFALGQALRYAIAAAILLPVAAWTGALVRLAPRQVALVVGLAATGLAGFNLCLLGSVSLGDPAVAGVVVGCTPLALALASSLVDRRRPPWAILVAALLASAGGALVQGTAGRFSAAALLLALGALGGELCFSLLAVPLLRTLRPVALSGYVCAAAAVLLALVAAVPGLGAAPRPPDTRELDALLFMALPVTVGAFLLWYTALRRIGSARASPFLGLVPVTSVLGAALLGTTQLSPLRVAGMALVLVALVLGLRLGAPRNPATTD